MNLATCDSAMTRNPDDRCWRLQRVLNCLPVHAASLGALAVVSDFVAPGSGSLQQNLKEQEHGVCKRWWTILSPSL